MLFRRKGACIILTILFAATRAQTPAQSNARSYDTNDWIPVSRPAEASQSDAQKRPTGRVLNLPAQDEKRFIQPNYTPNGQQQILLPPQLQSLISQGQAYISPQRINQQLQEYQPIPTQSFPTQSYPNINATEAIQNINAALYKQPQQNNEPEVQLLYVPLENLQRPRGQRQQLVAPPQVYNPPQQYQQPPVQHKQVQLQNIEQDFVQQALQAQKLQEQFQNYRRPFPEVLSQPQTTPAPKKRKPHQPPLAVYMGTEGQEDIKIGDVLSLLKEAKSISVQDTIGPDSPQVFVGPSHLAPPDGYTKFDLPYLSSIENNRVERKVDQLPFFVAPLSYKAPPGYSKIPFPAPHVGSVVINHHKATPSTTTEHSRYIYPQTLEDTSSHIPFSQPEVSTVRNTRGRQRQPTRNSYTSSTVTAEIPYGPLPTRVTPEVQQPHSVQETLISPNPYGPTRFVQSTTPTVSLPEEIFSTKNRFQNVQSTRQYSHHPEAEPTEPTLASSTLSSSLANDKYTVLEQFPIGVKLVQQNEETVPQRNPNRQQSRRPTQEPERTALPLISTTHQHEFDSSIQYHEAPQKNQRLPDNYQEVSTRQTYHEPTQKQRAPETYQEAPTRQTFHEPPPQNQRVPENYQEAPTRQTYHETPQKQRGSESYHEAPTRQTYHEPTQKQRVSESYQEAPTRQTYHEAPQKQRVSESYQEAPTRQTYHEATQKQRVSESHQEAPTRQTYHEAPQNQRVPETYQEAPSRQRITENYQPVQQVTQSSPVQQVLLKEQIPTQDYELPVRHVTQQSQIRGQQQYYVPELPLNLNAQFTSQGQTPRTRGKQHFTPNGYFQEDKTTESLVTVTKEPVIEYKIPDRDVYYQDEPHQEVIPSKQEYTLPAKLPPISPQLPGLINSLQDQQIRPLLAPLLLPPSEQPPVEEQSVESHEEYYSSPEPAPVHIPSTTPSTTTTSTTTTTTTTPAPVTDSSTQYKRTRSRQRGTRPPVSYDYVSTTSSPRRPSQYRGRRPYNGQPRQEYKPRENYPVSSTVLPEVTEATTRRNRHPQRQYVSSTTDQPRRAPTASSRTRFRTRGRPTKSEEEYIERSTPVFKQPALEGGFQASPPLLQQNVQLTVPTTHITDHEGNIADEPVVSQRPQKEQALIYIQNTNSPPIQEASPVPEVYIPRQQFISSTETLEPLHHSTIAATGPENNLVPDVIHEKPTVLSTQQHIKYSNPTETNLNSQEEYNSKEEPTTEFTRTRTRSRVKPRGRVHLTTARYQPVYSSTTTHRTTTEPKKETEEEFYGFFRQPNFAKPPQTEKPRPEYVSSTLSPRPNVAYLSRSTEVPQRLYENAPEDSFVQPNMQVQRQYISSTTEEPIVDIKPVTRRPALRPRRPIPSSGEQSSEKYHVRPTKRPDVQTVRPTRIRGRIRKPIYSSTVQSVETHPTRSNELDNNNEELGAAVKVRQRLTSRGKSHFQGPRSEKATEEPEEENYPVSFLQAHGVQQSSPSSIVYSSTPAASTLQPIVLTTPSAVTPRPAFQLTIEPEDSEEEYPDQIPYSSVNQPSVATKDLEEGLEESKFSAKFVEKPSNFNFIVSEEKPSSSTESDPKTTTTETFRNEETTTENIEATTTDLPTTTEPSSERPKGRRRGVWRLVKTRPVADDFESAESQNIQSIFNDNEFSYPDKPIRKYKVVHRIRTTTESLTTQNVPETTTESLNEITTQKLEDPSTTEASIFAPLYEMFGYNSQQHLLEETPEVDVTTTENPTMFNTAIEEVETTTFTNTNSTEIPSVVTEDKSSSFDPSRVIGTSTTTEISHETEICYRGRCVKSASTEENSEERL